MPKDPSQEKDLESKSTALAEEEIKETATLETEEQRLERLYGPKTSSDGSEQPQSEEELVIMEEEVDVIEEHPAETEEEDDEDFDLSADRKDVHQTESPLMAVENGLVKFLYDIFNPLLLPAYATLLIFELSILAVVAKGAALPYTLTVFGATCVLPLLALIFLRRFGIISSFSIDSRRERLVPYIIEFVAFGAMALFFVYKGASTWLWLVYAGAAAVTLVNCLINFKIRICNHASAIAGMLAVLIIIQNDGLPHHNIGWWALGTVMMAGIIGSAAMLVGKHKLIDVLAGYATGFLGILLFSLIK